MHFVIFAPGWNETVGGVIVLHLLCDRLNEAGHKAAIWPWDRPRLSFPSSLGRIKRALEYELAGRSRFPSGPFLRRLASYSDLRDAVIVYPEVTSGNPLKARRVVRWFLHRPGFHTGGCIELDLNSGQA